MKLVLANLNFLNRGGSETYLLTVGAELVRLGHDVTIFSSEPGADPQLAASAGLEFVSDTARLADSVDAVLVQDGVLAYELAHQLPEVPQLFVCHSGAIDLQLPPQLDGFVSTAVVMNDRVERRLAALATPPSRIVRLRQPVDLRLLRRPSTLPERPRRLLFLGNNAAPERRDALVDACAHHDIEYIEMGERSGRAGDPAAEIAAADIVVGYGRCIVEAMMTGRAAYVYDHAGGDGWVTPETYPAIEADGFVGRSANRCIDRQALIEDLAVFDPEMGSRNRDLAVANHDASAHAAALVDLFADLAAPSPVDHASELARAVRSAWVWESRSLQLQAELSNLNDVVTSTRNELEATERSAEHLQDEIERVHADRVAFEATPSFRLARRLGAAARRARSLGR